MMLIIGVLAGVTLSAIDRVRERSLFDQTMAEMKSLLKGITGDPDLLSDGARIDFGYVGDMGKLPDSLASLIRPEGGLWNGPYYKVLFQEDEAGFKKDAWGNPYQYSPEDLTLRSFGNGRVTLTLKIADSLSDLFNNTIQGQILDRDNTPPGTFANRMKLKITYPRNGELVEDSSLPSPDGFYQFTNIPIGRHWLKLSTPYETLGKYVVITPRSNVSVDFKIPRLLKGNLVYLSSDVFPSDSTTLYFFLHNVIDETVKVFHLTLWEKEDTLVVFYDSITAKETTYARGSPKWREGEVATFTDTLRFLPDEVVKLTIGRFTDSLNNDQNMYQKKLKIRTSDGSLIEFNVGK